VSYSVNQLFAYLGEVTFNLLSGVGVFVGVLAGLDFLFQRWDLEKQMRMTKQEVKEEHKSREGDPLVRARIRRVQREMATRRMMDEVPKADVVITNPTHIAVALRYSETMVAPTIVAKGAGAIAEKIKQVARDKGIPVVENKPLARTIFKTLEIGQAIPRELYTAVAEVLSYVFRLKKKKGMS
jgi:flagellar biosynthetic protein FlhB